MYSLPAVSDLNAEPNWKLERCVQHRRKTDGVPVE
jgi:hypothetical protein